MYEFILSLDDLFQTGNGVPKSSRTIIATIGYINWINPTICLGRRRDQSHRVSHPFQTFTKNGQEVWYSQIASSMRMWKISNWRGWKWVALLIILSYGVPECVMPSWCLSSVFLGVNCIISVYWKRPDHKIDCHDINFWRKEWDVIMIEWEEHPVYYLLLLVDNATFSQLKLVCRDEGLGDLFVPCYGKGYSGKATDVVADFLVQTKLLTWFYG